MLRSTAARFVLVVSSCVLCAAPLAPAASAQAVTSAVSPAAPPSAAGKLTQRQKIWRAATIGQRAVLTERIGDEGARHFARSKGWRPVFNGLNRGIPQGIDQIYRDAQGYVRAIEAKGGGSPLGRGYGFEQGTPEHAVEAAKRVLKSSKTTAAEKAAAREVLEAAASKRLRSDVIRTRHVFGEPTAAVLERTLDTGDDAAKMAREALRQLNASAGRSAPAGASKGAQAARKALASSDDLARAKTPVARSAGEAARTAKGGIKAGGVLRTASKLAPVAAVAIDGGLRGMEAYEVEQAYHEGRLSEQQRETAHAKNAAGMVGGWGGAIAGAKVGGATGAAAGTCAAPGVGTAIGAVAGSVSGAVAGYVAGEAAAERAAEWTMNKIHQGGTTVRDTYYHTQRRVRDFWENLW